MTGVLFVYEGAVARRCRRRRTRPCVCSCAARFSTAAAAAAAVAAVRARGCLLCGSCGCAKFGSVLVQVPNRYRFVYSSRNSEVARAHITFLPFSTGIHVIWAGYVFPAPGWSNLLWKY